MHRQMAHGSQEAVRATAASFPPNVHTSSLSTVLPQHPSLTQPDARRLAMTPLLTPAEGDAHMGCPAPMLCNSDCRLMSGRWTIYGVHHKEEDGPLSSLVPTISALEALLPPPRKSPSWVLYDSGSASSALHHQLLSSALRIDPTPRGPDITCMARTSSFESYLLARPSSPCRIGRCRNAFLCAGCIPSPDPAAHSGAPSDSLPVSIRSFRKPNFGISHPTP
ncbi:hypothetical protein NLJ89_g11527 [Agrocybe chaxingu]|uniref:Uncharacterized protein n=1 Tax=Agrocybe chaxingu TaxID=84603 RepID=A0A9W8JLQ9_9AGAR|nr:hypothetical protein NLJ89_g11527 [Agrocybe chaxingu]